MKELVMIIRPEKLEDIKHILDKNALHHWSEGFCLL